jgi:FixJ family two-component response regulator
MTEVEATVFVVDDDESIREALKSLIRSVGLRVETYASAREFLQSRNLDEPGCLILNQTTRDWNNATLAENHEVHGAHEV